jgi:D-alanine-D-alanine ligase
MRITVLAHLARESSQQLDAVVGQVASALRKGGHKVSILGVHADLSRLISGLKKRKPELIFNLMETFGRNELGAAGLAGVLNVLGFPHTGGGPGEIYIQGDKGLATKLLAFEKLLYPDFMVFTPDTELETVGKLRFPLIVKPLHRDASIGIDGNSLVRNVQDLMRRIKEIHHEIHDAALVEEYIEGRDIYVGVLGNHEPQALSPIEIEMDFSQLHNGRPHIADAEAKWNGKSTQYQDTQAIVPDLPDELRAKLHKVALEAYQALRVRDYGRIDLRLTDDGDIYVIEVNASCYLERSTEFAMAAALAGLDYVSLINKIVELAAVRQERLTPAPSR